jgi:1-acyl-sn-glycerol-3-phosphate acyltransferase
MGLRHVFSTLFWSFLVTTSFACFPIAVLIWAVTAPFDPKLRLLHQFTCFWASLYTWFNPAWPVHIEGLEHIQPGEAYVMVANHQSLLDILVMFRLFNHYKWVSKIENFRLPLIGLNMRLNRYIELRRGDRASVMQMLENCTRALNDGNSIMMFPEGTRSLDGKMRDFKPGAFELALKCERPLLPIVLDGTSNALPKRGFVLQGRHDIKLKVLAPLPAAEFAHQTVDELSDRVRKLIASELERGTGRS